MFEKRMQYLFLLKEILFPFFFSLLTFSKTLGLNFWPYVSWNGICLVFSFLFIGDATGGDKGDSGSVACLDLVDVGEWSHAEDFICPVKLFCIWDRKIRPGMGTNLLFLWHNLIWVIHVWQKMNSILKASKI